MATEKQIGALDRWLGPMLRENEEIGEMPKEVCTDALDVLIRASNEYREGKIKRGSVARAKKRVIKALRVEGWIGPIPTTPAEEEQQEQKQETETKPEPVPTQTQPATTPKLPVAELIARYTDLLAQVTEAVNAEDRIPQREKGYGVKFVYYSVKHALENGKAE